jgi:hypothetical protein
MQQIFLSRDRAVQLLMYRKRKPVCEIMRMESAESSAYRAAVVTDIEQLVLDGKAGRLLVFELVEREGTIFRLYVS